MIRFIKNILDIRNLLGKNPIPPDPTPLLDRVTCRSVLANTGVQVEYSGYLIVRYVLDGEQRQQQIYSEDYTTANIPLTIDEGSVFTASATNLRTLTVRNNYRYEYLATSLNLQRVTFINTQTDLQTLDFRNSRNISSFPASGAPNIKRIYAIIENDFLQTRIPDIINNSTVTDGELWIKKNARSAESIAAAINKGWTVKSL